MIRLAQMLMDQALCHLTLAERMGNRMLPHLFHLSLCSQQVLLLRLLHKLDRVIALTCVIFFLVSIGVNYLLVARIFDTNIAATVALLMLFCELMWSFSQSGLPQMLMLMLFSCAMFFTWRAVENTEENRSALTPILLSGIFMCLLVLTHWITLGVYVGYVIFAAVYFQPRGIMAALLVGILAVC